VCERERMVGSPRFDSPKDMRDGGLIYTYLVLRERERDNGRLWLLPLYDKLWSNKR